jgi:hypothetical protein
MKVRISSLLLLVFLTTVRVEAQQWDKYIPKKRLARRSPMFAALTASVNRPITDGKLNTVASMSMKLVASSTSKTRIGG